MYKIENENLDRLLGDIYKELDIPDELFQDAIDKYDHLGRWLQIDSAERFKADSLLYLQGSALLGTSVKPIRRGDEYDFDLVYKRFLSKESVTQEELKTQVGEQLGRYIEHLKKNGGTEIPVLEEGKRCWTLRYPGKFHMDILPALPDPEPHYLMNPDDGIIITDRDLLRWQFSNPKGFAAWFRAEMREAFFENRARLAKSSNVEIEEVPESRVRTTLQKAIQILKRHRDVYYQGHSEEKPISIIITTLAAQSYDNNGNLYLTLKTLSDKMAAYIENRDGEYWVQNPINPKENFADKWKDSPRRKDHFFQWLESVRETFSYNEDSKEEEVNRKLSKSLNIDATAAVSSAYKRAGLSAAARAVSVKTEPWSQ